MRPDDDGFDDFLFLFGGDFGLSAGNAAFLCASRKPARVRSRIISRSNSAKEPSICIIMRPAGPDVSIDSVSERNLAPMASMRSRMDEQVLERPRQPVELPDDEGVAGAHLIEQPMQFGTIPSSAGRRFLEDFLAAGFFEHADLRRGVLIFGLGDAGVAEQHDCRFFCCQTLSFGNRIRQSASR